MRERSEIIIRAWDRDQRENKKNEENQIEKNENEEDQRETNENEEDQRDKKEKVRRDSDYEREEKEGGCLVSPQQSKERQMCMLGLCQPALF